MFYHAVYEKDLMHSPSDSKIQYNYSRNAIVRLFCVLR